MQTNPLSPSRATSKPEAVRSLIVARPEIFGGAALRASATSASRGSRYSFNAGYLALPGVTAQTADTADIMTSKNPCACFTPLLLSQRLFADEYGRRQVPDTSGRNRPGGRAMT